MIRADVARAAGSGKGRTRTAMKIGLFDHGAPLNMAPAPGV
jgi:hypothetical protein